MAIKISKVIKDLNIGRQTIEEFLHKKGIELDASINARIQDDVYEMLVKEFKPDMDFRSKLDKRLKERQIERERLNAAKASHEIKTVIPGQKPKVLGRIDLYPKQSSTAEKPKNIQEVESHEQEQEHKLNVLRTIENDSYPNLTQSQNDIQIDFPDVEITDSDPKRNDTENADSDTINNCLFEKKYYKLLSDILHGYDRCTPSMIVELKPEQIFVFGTDQRGSQRYGAAGIAAERFGAQRGVIDGPTGSCYALPTKGFTIEDLSKSVVRFEQFVRDNPSKIFLVTAVGCGHAGFDINEVAHMFQCLIGLNNVMLPKEFIEVFRSDCREQLLIKDTSIQHTTEDTNTKGVDNTILQQFDESLHDLIKFLLINNIDFNHDCGFTLTDANGEIIGEAELCIKKERIIFLPFNSQSETAFKNSGYTICDPEEYLKTKN